MDLREVTFYYGLSCLLATHWVALVSMDAALRLLTAAMAFIDA